MIPLQIIIDIFENVYNNYSSPNIKKNYKYPKILFVGDPAQLPPINETVSVIFAQTNEDFNIHNNIDNLKDKLDIFKHNIINSKNITLKKIVRNNNNKVIGVCNEIRKWIISKKYIPKIPKYKGPKVKLYKTKNNKIKTNWFNKYLEYINNDINSIILTWTNRQSDEYNNVTRYNIFNTNDLPKFQKGDILIFKDFYSINYDQENKNTFYTSEQIKIVDIEEVIMSVEKFPENFPNKLQIKYNNHIHNTYKRIIKNINRNLCWKYNTWKLYVKKINSVNTFIIYVIKEEYNDSIIKDREYVIKKIKELRRNYISNFRKQISQIDDIIIKFLWKEYYRLLLEPYANIDYAYSATVHVSQGSDFYNVFIDANDILKNKNENEAKRCLYTAFTRTSNELHILI